MGGRSRSSASSQQERRCGRFPGPASLWNHVGWSRLLRSTPTRISLAFAMASRLLPLRPPPHCIQLLGYGFGGLNRVFLPSRKVPNSAQYSTWAFCPSVSAPRLPAASFTVLDQSFGFATMLNFWAGSEEPIFHTSISMPKKRNSSCEIRFSQSSAARAGGHLGGRPTCGIQPWPVLAAQQGGVRHPQDPTGSQPGGR